MLRPMGRWVALWFSLPRPVRHRLIVREAFPYSGRSVHVANLERPEDLDDDLRGWLTEAHLAAG